MNRFYVVAAIIIALLAAVWISKPAQLRDEERSAVNRAATEVMVSEERVYCHDPKAAPSYTVQLGGCLPGAQEVTYSEYRTGTADQ